MSEAQIMMIVVLPALLAAVLGGVAGAEFERRSLADDHVKGVESAAWKRAVIDARARLEKAKVAG